MCSLTVCHSFEWYFKSLNVGLCETNVAFISFYAYGRLYRILTLLLYIIVGNMITEMPDKMRSSQGFHWIATLVKNALLFFTFVLVHWLTKYTSLSPEIVFTINVDVSNYHKQNLIYLHRQLFGFKSMKKMLATSSAPSTFPTQKLDSEISVPYNILGVHRESVN